MIDVQVIIGNYRASKKNSFLAYLDALSDARMDGGLLHGGHIHYNQGKMRDPLFVLKAAIAGVLENVPDVFPLDLPEIVERNPDFEPTEAMIEAYRKINERLIFPIGGGEIIDIIRCAREYVGLQDFQC